MSIPCLTTTSHSKQCCSEKCSLKKCAFKKCAFKKVRFKKVCLLSALLSCKPCVRNVFPLCSVQSVMNNSMHCTSAKLLQHCTYCPKENLRGQMKIWDKQGAMLLKRYTYCPKKNLWGQMKIWDICTGWIVHRAKCSDVEAVSWLQTI